MKKSARLSRPLLISLAISIVLVIGMIDSQTPPQLSFSFFYLIPIIWACFYLSIRAGIFLALLSVVISLMADLMTTSGIFFPRWNACVKLGVYLVVIYILARRKDTEAQLTQSEERFRLLVDGVRDYAIISLNSQGEIVSWNQAAERIHGYRIGEIIDKNFAVFYPQKEIEMELPQKELMQSLKHDRLSKEGWQIRKDGSAFWADILITALKDESDNLRGFSLLVRDVTERKKAEEAIRTYAQLHEIDRSILAAQSSEMVAQEALRGTRKLIPFEQASITIFDFDKEEFLILAVAGKNETLRGKHFPMDLFGIEDSLKQQVVQFVKEPSPTTSFLAGLDSKILRSYVYIPIFSQGELIASLNLGMTTGTLLESKELNMIQEVANQLAVALSNAKLFERVQQSHNRLKTLSQRLLQVQETERRHLARELHDEMGQALTAVKLHLQEIEGAGEITSSFVSHVQESIHVIEQILQQVRNLSLNLRPLLLDDLGLVAALRWFISRQGQLSGFVAHFSPAPLTIQLSSELETACFRVVQEALTNIAKHANAKNVTVELYERESELSLVIHDDGVGFDLIQIQDKSSAGVSLGLLGMRERVSLLGGQIEVESAPNYGTEIRARFPLARSKEIL